MASDDRNVEKCYEAVIKLVDEAGAIIAKRNDGRTAFEEKSGYRDLVTETDVEVEKLLTNGLSTKFPSHKFIGEEDSADGKMHTLTNEPTWIIDPVDGTMNFVHGFPHSCISIAFVLDKVTEIGIVFNPILNQKFTARRGQGSYYNGRKIQVSGQTKLNKALLTSEFGTTQDPGKAEVVIENFTKMAKMAHGIRVLGAAALNMSMVALGAADANYEMGIHAWDVAAGDLLVREAGGVVIDISGGEFDMMSRRVLAASSMELAQDIAKKLTPFQPLPRDDGKDVCLS